jgi:hypothetical protein
MCVGEVGRSDVVRRGGLDCRRGCGYKCLAPSPHTCYAHALQCAQLCPSVGSPWIRVQATHVGCGCAMRVCGRPPAGDFMPRHAPRKRGSAAGAASQRGRCVLGETPRPGVRWGTVTGGAGIPRRTLTAVGCLLGSACCSLRSPAHPWTWRSAGERRRGERRRGGTQRGKGTGGTVATLQRWRVRRAG